ncbi:MAG: hypothetical protein Q7T72_13670 [Bacteroidales bacterium]|nr:hypothetical protein [Bacteroidales bacterium]
MSPFSKNFTTGDVISVAWFPHEEDKTQGEARWLICLEDLQDEFIAIPLKSTTNHLKDQPNSFIIQKDSEEGKRMNLLNDSLVVPGRAIQRRKVKASIEGHCSVDLIDKLNELIK